MHLIAFEERRNFFSAQIF